MEDNIEQVVKDVKYLIATDCNDETIQARIENFIKERDEALSIANVVRQNEQLAQENKRLKKACQDFINSVELKQLLRQS